MEMWFCCLYLKLYMLLMAVDFFAISRYGSSYILYCFASSRNGLCYSLWSLCHSVPPIFYMVLVYLNIDTVRSHHRNIFLYLYILYNFFVHWVWVHFDNIVRFFKNPFIDVHLLITGRVLSRKEMPVSSQYSVIQ